MDSVNSTTFIKRPPFMTDVQEKFLYTKELLSGRIFLGSYLEKRYVTVLQDYRDVVFVSSEETDLQHDLDKIRKKWIGVKELKWVGITGPGEFGFPKSHCLWLKLTNLAIGQYWFQIKHVKLVDKEIVFQLKCIRKSQVPLCSATPEIREDVSEPQASKPGTSTSAPEIGHLKPQTAVSSFQETCIGVFQTLGPFLTITNLITAVRVTSALIIVLVMGIISLVGHLGEYVLKLIREFSYLVQAFTPIVIQLIDFLSKIIGGLFILIAGMFRGETRPPTTQPFRNELFRSGRILQTGRNVTQALDWRERNRLLRQEFLGNPLPSK